MCKRSIELHSSEGDIKKIKCERPDYRNGLCAYHYRKQSIKNTPWGERTNYVQATESSKLLKLKSGIKNLNYRIKDSIVQVFNSKNKSWVNTTILPI